MIETRVSFANLLREQGYSEVAVEEICKWYIDSIADKLTRRVTKRANN